MHPTSQSQSNRLSATSPSNLASRRRSHISRIGVLVALLATFASVLAIADPAQARVVRYAGPDYALRISPDAIRVFAGQEAEFPVTVITSKRVSLRPTFEVLGVPKSIDAEVVRVATNRFVLRFYVPSNAPSSNGVYQLKATSSKRVRTALFRLEVVSTQPPVTQPPVTQPPVTQPPVTQPPVTQPPATQPPVTTPPQFGVRVDSSEQTVETGATVVYGISVDRSSGYTGPVSLSVVGAPSGLVATYAPNPTFQSTNLYLTPNSTVKAGRYVFTVLATAGSSQRVAAIAVTVKATSDFALLATPAAFTLNGVASQASRIDVAAVSAVRPVVNFEVAGLPNGLTTKFSATSTAASSTVLTVSSSGNVPSGTYPLVVTGRSGQFVRQVIVTVTVTNNVGFGITTSPTLQLTRSGSNALIVQIQPFGGFKGTVNLTATNLPSGVTVTPVTGATTAGTLILSASSAVVPGTYTISVVGTNAAISAAVQVTLTVQ